MTRGLLLPAAAALGLSSCPYASAQEAPAETALNPVGRASDCRPLPAVGCFYVPASARDSESPPLLVYLRGRHQRYGARVEPDDRVGAARDAFVGMRLGALAESSRVVVLVAGSSCLGVSKAHVEAVERQAGKKSGRLILASHSSGYIGLMLTLPLLPRPDRVVLLDNFHFKDSMSKMVQRRVEQGTDCVGFYTRTRRDAYLRYFKPHATCSVEDQDARGHDGGVRACLGAYLSSTACP
ncbi:MAG: hypothetical protein HY927_13910 [Elusimicrobia bacterium]|nr:hypothetical protein [Elusimicrobiota bacterium]